MVFCPGGRLCPVLSGGATIDGHSFGQGAKAAVYFKYLAGVMKLNTSVSIETCQSWIDTLGAFQRLGAGIS